MSTKKKTTQNSTTITTPTNPDWVTNGLQTQVGRIGDLAAADPFSFVAGPGDLQRRGFEVVGGLADYTPGLFEDAALAGRAAMDYQPGAVSAQAIDPARAFASFGAADPTAALARSLSGAVDNPFLAAMNQASINQAMQGYDDALSSATRTLTDQALPAIRGGAVLAGQYGGSRQGIAEGLALSDVGRQAALNARNLAQLALDSGAQLYGGAYESAQSRAAQTAATLAALGIDAARGNADRAMQADTADAANGLNAAQLNLQGGQALGGLGEQTLSALGQFGQTQQQLDALRQRAPLDLLTATSGLYGQLPLNLLSGSTQTSNGTTYEKQYGLGNALSVAGQLGFAPFKAFQFKPFGPFAG
jgi:hypothetical protein